MSCMKTVNDLNRLATVTPVWGCSVDDLRGLAREAEKGGIEAIFSPEVPPFSALSNAQVFAEATSTIHVGTWITSIYMRQPVMCAAEALTVQEISKSRMVLGLGVSHRPVVTDRFGIDMGDPTETMRKYVVEIKSFIDGSSPLITIKREIQPFPVYIAALTEKAAELAGEVANGIMSYLATPEHVTNLAAALHRGADRAGRSATGIDITHGIPCFVSSDLDQARESARRGLWPYFARFPFYQRLARNIGYQDVIEKINEISNPAEALSDEFLDSIALIGPPERCRRRLEQYRAAGVKLPIIVPNPVGKQNNIEVMKNMIQALCQ